MSKTIDQIVEFLEQFAPPMLAEDWDNTGLLIGDRDGKVDRILTCLTLTPDVAEEAIDKGVQLVVSHHPVLFRKVQKITSDDAEGQMLLRLIRAGVAVYSPHTSFDSAENGINRQLAPVPGDQSRIRRLAQVLTPSRLRGLLEDWRLDRDHHGCYG